MVLLPLPTILFLFLPPISGAFPMVQTTTSTEVAQGAEAQDPWHAARQRVPEDQLPGWDFLLEHMPASDRASLDVELVLENVDFAYRAWREAPWRESVDEELFLNEILPYCNINERRDRWRKDFYQRFQPLVADAQSPGEAATILNRLVFPEVGVIYSTERPKADQSPYESIDAGLASCTGLSVLLVDACRSVGVPARFVGTPLWADGSGNHSWVEVWDDGWHFTGAAEPTGDRLDEAWFTDRAAQALADDRDRAIYAVSYRRTPLSLPMVWDPDADEVFAVNVTDRYVATQDLAEGSVRLRIRARAEGQRLAAAITIQEVGGDVLFQGTTRDESYDANDHLIAPLTLGQTVEIRAVSLDQAHTLHLQVPVDGSLLDFTFGRFLETRISTPSDLLWEEHRAHIRRTRKAEMDARVLRVGELEMPFAYTVYGDKPEDGRSLYISMHGGGGAPKEVNDQQWENQQRLYAPAEGIYLAPRAPTDTWNLWHQEHIDLFFDRLIENLIAFEDVNPDRIYLMGYSAGGDGVYQLAPRMADRWAAAAMMAGHPNDAKPDSLHNLPFTLHMGAEDGAYDRNKVAAAWGEQLQSLAAVNPGGYPHEVRLHAGKGHWMDREDAVAVPWMAQFRRDLRPERVVWQQDDVVHRRFYWLYNPAPKPRCRVVVSRARNTFTVEESQEVSSLILRMDESMVDFDQEVVVVAFGKEMFRGRVTRDLDVLRRTLKERGDPQGMWSAEVHLELPAPPSAQEPAEEEVDSEETAKVFLERELHEVLSACVAARKELDVTGEPKEVEARLLAKRQRLQELATEGLLSRGVVANADPQVLASLASLLSMQALIEGKGGKEIIVEEWLDGDLDHRPWACLRLGAPSEWFERVYTVPMVRGEEGWQVIAAILPVEQWTKLLHAGNSSPFLLKEECQLHAERRWREVGLHWEHRLSPPPERERFLFGDSAFYDVELAVSFAESLTIEFDPYEAEAALLCDRDLPVEHLVGITRLRPEQTWTCSFLVQGPVMGQRYLLPVRLSAAEQLPDWASKLCPTQPAMRLAEDGRVEVQLQHLGGIQVTGILLFRIMEHFRKDP